ncbi:MAG: hypothetical protein FJW31_23135 [Acidobacteria bacterium]|nr:hypothetical protein [Acidobacteriota bacterium]
MQFDSTPNLPAPVPPEPARPPTAAAAAAAISPGWDFDIGDAPTPLSHYLWTLRRQRWKILSFVTACVAATVIICARRTPIYESTVTIDVDRKMPTSILGAESVQSAINDAYQFLSTQIKLIQSDSVLRPVAEKYKLREQEDEDREGDRKQDPQLGDTPVLLKRLNVARPPNTCLLSRRSWRKICG